MFPVLVITLTLAVVTEAITEVLKPIYKPIIAKVAETFDINLQPEAVTPVVATAIGVGLAIGAEANLLEEAGVVGIVGTLVTGFAIGRGSAFVQELYNMLRGGG